MTPEDNGPSAFFKAMTSAFRETIAARRNYVDLVGALCAQAFDSFERNVEIQAEGAPALACKGECAACCTLQVAVTAPEAFLLARFIGANRPAFESGGIDLCGRIAALNAQVAGLSQQQRLALRRPCAFIEKDLCLAYRLRPLACRGHASFDREACEKVTAGESVETNVSTPHLTVRSLVQNAMLSALRDARLPWGLYELAQATHIALSDSDAVARWISGEDPFSKAVVAEFDFAEAAVTFDALAAG